MPVSPATVARDLGPLSWVMDELRGTLDDAVACVRQFVDDNATARATDLAEVDTAPLRMVRQRLHQAAGALDMVELAAAAHTLRALETLVQRLVQKPAAATAELATQVAHGALAVLDYLERWMRERPVPDLALFPVVESWLQAAGAPRVHPADLWAFQPRAVATPPEGKAYQPSAAVRAHLDRLVLPVVKGLSPQAATPLAQLSAGLSRGATDAAIRQFWLAAGAYFEAVAQAALPDDVYVKRAASRILTQYSHLAQGSTQGLDLLTHDLCFLAAKAVASAGPATPCLQALQQAHAWGSEAAWDYHRPVLGLFDPADLLAAQQAVGAAQQAWSLWTEGDAKARERSIASLHALGQRLQALGAASVGLAGAWAQVAQALGQPDMAPTPKPPVALALEVANSLLFLGAELADFDPLDAQLPQRHAALTQRLQEVLAGQPAPPPELWMTQLYRGLSERQTLNHVVGQLKAELNDIEQVLDGFFRRPDVAHLHGVPPRLEAMLGVVAMLGLAPAEQSLAWLRDAVAAWAARTDVPTAPELSQAVQTLGPNLSALGWLLETLVRQPALARDGFVFDTGRHLLRSRSLPPTVAGDIALPTAPPVEASAPVSAPAPVPAVDAPPEAVAAVPSPDHNQAQGEDEDDSAELLAIFIDEAREVLRSARTAITALGDQADSLADLTTLRRSFHTLKGSARMVGLTEVGEAAWAMEQLLNTWLADQQPASAALLDLCRQATDRFERWVNNLAAGGAEADADHAQPFRRSADALRVDGHSLPLDAEAGPEPEPPVLDDAVKVIGPLCIDLELFNVYLSEADEWSRYLSEALGEWALQPGTPVPEDASRWAHSLAGGSATVGYTGLSMLARAVEHALERVLDQPGAGAATPPDDAQVLVHAAEEARHLLHQFAAGFLKEPNADTLAALAEVGTHWVEAVPEPAPAVEVEPLPDRATVQEPAAEAAIDHLDADLFAVFEDEAQELLPRLGAALRQWAARPDNASARAEVLRNLHTFKGSARLAGALRLGDMAHGLESDVLALPEQPPQAEEIRPLLNAMDALVARFDDLRAAFAESAAGQPLTVEGVLPQAPETLAPLEVPAAAPWGQPNTAPAVEVVAMQPRTTATDAVPPALLPGAVPPAALPSVRVRAELLDQLMVQTGDVMITRTRLEADMRALRQSFRDMTGNIERLRHQLRDLEIQTETQMQSRMAQSRDTDARFDPLEFDRFTRVQEITRLLAESVNDVATVQHSLQRAVEGAEGSLAAQARQTRELQRDLLRTRLVEFDSLAERLHRVVRQTAQALDKDAELDIVNGLTEVDRGVLDRLTPVLEHLLRNAVVHGIEQPDLRTQAGKPAQGRIVIALQQQGNDLSLTLTDDGAGLDMARLRDRAVAQGLLAADAPFGAAEAARCMFAPGVSTATEVTELAGRGIGLDVVRNDILGLGGHIGHFVPAGGGTGFELVVPLTTAVTQVVMLRVGDFTFGVPAPWVEAVRRAHAPELTAAYVSGQWREADHLMPFFWAGALLALSTESTDPQAHEARSWPVLEFYSGGQRVAWHVDEVLGHQEVVVKPLGPQLAHLPGLAGATVLASGAVALIYNPVALASLYGDAARTWVRAQRAQGVQGVVVPAQVGQVLPGPAGQAPLVLVVDDSITVRRVTQRLLKREGYRVALAADGLQALERLRDETPVVVLCDIEMPHMDGFEFVRHLRSDARWATLPVVMITSRLADKHREHAQSMGVDHYLGKPYAEEELLALVAGYARLAAS